MYLNPTLDHIGGVSIDGGMSEEMREAVVGDDATSWAGSSGQLITDRLSFGSQSSVEHSAGYWERQTEANRAPLSSLTVCFVGCEIYHGN